VKPSLRVSSTARVASFTGSEACDTAAAVGAASRFGRQCGSVMK